MSSTPPTIGHILLCSTQKLEKTSLTPRLDAEILLACVLGKNREYILAYPEEKITRSKLFAYEKLLKRRLQKEPTAYILGQKEFYGLNFKLNRHTLIPRPETELLVDKTLELFRKNDPGSFQKNIAVGDIGTGSGNIIVSAVKNLSPLGHLCKNQKAPVFFATDISSQALQIARKNARINLNKEKIKFFHSDLLDFILKKRFSLQAITDLILVANLPYLSSKILSAAPQDVRNFEPISALKSKQEGLGHYQKLFQQVKKIEKKYPSLRCHCLVEISPEQKNKIEKKIKAYFPERKISSWKDLSGKWRVIYF